MAPSGLLRAQGATEYLILLAAVLLIGTIVASLLGYFTGYSSGLTESESHVYWQSVAKPIRILEAVQNTMGCECSDVCITTVDVFRVVVQNTQSNPIILRQVVVDGNNTAVGNVCLSPSLENPTDHTENVTLNPGKQVTIGVISTSKKCTSANQLIPMALSLKYSSRGLDLVQTGEKDFLMRCA